MSEVSRSAATCEADRFDFIVRLKPDRARIELFGELDSVTVPRLGRRIDGLLGRFEHLELDLTHLEFLGSAGITLFAGTATRAGGCGTVTLLHPRRGVQRILGAVTLPACVHIEAAPFLDGADRLHDQLERAIVSRASIEQAQGVIAEQAGVEMAEASSAMRAYARDANLRLTEVAATIVASQRSPD